MSKKKFTNFEVSTSFSAWSRYWVINSCKGRGQSCSWLPQQFGYRNGIFDTGKTTIFSNWETNEQHCNWNSSSKLNNSSLRRHFSTPPYSPGSIEEFKRKMSTSFLKEHISLTWFCNVIFLIVFLACHNSLVQVIFLQANTDEELPEYLLGTCRLNHLDASKAVLLKS